MKGLIRSLQDVVVVTKSIRKQLFPRIPFVGNWRNCRYLASKSQQQATRILKSDLKFLSTSRQVGIMDEHGQIHADNLPTGQKVVVAGAVPKDLYINSKLDWDDLGRAYHQYFGTTKYVLIDLSGTLHIENAETPGAIQALKKLRDAGVKVKFVTNTTKESKNRLFKRLTDIGFVLDKDEIFTSLIAARRKIEELKVRPYFLIEEEAMEDFEGIETENPSGVVVGLSPTNFDYTGLTKAFRLLFHGCPLIAIHKGKYFRQGEGKLSLGPGPFVHALEYATGSTAVVVGKPNPTFFKSALDDASVLAPDVVMIGDDVEDDVIGAMDAGFRGILVKTGKYQHCDELKCHPKFPTVVVDSFSYAVDLIVAALSTAIGEPLKETPKEISKNELKKQAEERENQRKLDAYTKSCTTCYPDPYKSLTEAQVKEAKMISADEYEGVGGCILAPRITISKCLRQVIPPIPATNISEGIWIIAIASILQHPLEQVIPD